MEPSGEEGVQVIGFIQPQYEYRQQPAELDGTSNDISSFYFNRARLGVMGVIPYDFSYYVVMEFSPTLNGGMNPQPPRILDAFVSYKRFDPYINASIGQFKSPFGVELLTPCHKLYTIQRSVVVENLVHPWRDLGLMVFGGTGDLSLFGSKTKNLFGYQFAVMNGSGINQFDDNRTKDYIGRLTFHPVDFLTVGASYRFGKHPPAADGVETPDQRQRLGFDLQVNYKNLVIQGEFVHGSDEGSYTTGGGCGGEVEVHEGSVDRNGFFVLAAYKTPWKFEPVIKVERYDPNLDMSTDNLDFSESMAIQNTITYGLNYHFNDKVRFQANYLYRAEEDASVEIDNDAFIMQFQIVF